MAAFRSTAATGQDTVWPESAVEPSWFHAIELPDGRASGGRFAGRRPPNYTLYGVFDLLNAIDLHGLTVLDVGAMDGLVSFGLKMRGAAEVLATDLVARPNFLRLRDELGLQVDYHVPCRAQDLDRHFDGRHVDVLVMAGVLYHLIDPLSSLLACRRLLPRDGLMVLETQFLAGAQAPVARFNPAETGRQASAHTNVYWRMSLPALTAMLQLCSFEVLASVRLKSRIAVLARAASPDEIAVATPKIGTMLAGRRSDPSYHEAIEDAAAQAGADADRRPPSRARYAAARGPRRRWMAEAAPDWPLQPRHPADPARLWAERAWAAVSELRWPA
jgi:hypothetical protein